jgi:hypothetical protein
MPLAIARDGPIRGEPSGDYLNVVIGEEGKKQPQGKFYPMDLAPLWINFPQASPAL